MLKNILEYFQTLEFRPLERLGFLVAGLLIGWIAEGQIPFLQLRYKKNKMHHAQTNFLYTIIHLLIHTILAVFIIRLSDWCKIEKTGLVYWFNLNTMGTIVISMLVLDFFGGWLVHFTEHKIRVLWLFHVIHHADNNVDVTTGLRHHPVESLLRGIFFFIGIILSGSPMYAVMMFQTLLVISTAFTHANIALPKTLDKIISWVLVSPAMHKVHHHWKQPYTDSNYGAIFSIWDRLLMTYKRLSPDQIKYGLDKDYPNEGDENFIQLLKSPFMKHQ